MSEINKRPQVIRDLIEIATHIAEDNLDTSDRCLTAVEETFKQLAKTPGMGKLSRFSNSKLASVRQQAVKGFRKFLIFYRPTDSGVEILRVIHGARDIAEILDEDMEEDDSEHNCS